MNAPDKIPFSTPDESPPTDPEPNPEGGVENPDHDYFPPQEEENEEDEDEDSPRAALNILPGTLEQANKTSTTLH